MLRTINRRPDTQPRVTLLQAEARPSLGAWLVRGPQHFEGRG